MAGVDFVNNGKYSDSEHELIRRAFALAEKAHAGQKRLSGEDFITHPLAVAELLSGLNFDSASIIAALLHDTLEDTAITSKIITDNFGADVAFLVEGVTKLKKIDYQPGITGKSKNQYVQMLKKMFFAMAEDLRVILIKLADRLHNMQTLQYRLPADRERVAFETLEIYAPIAARLGMGDWKGQLEDLAFQYAHPMEYAWLKRKIKEKHKDLARYLERTKPVVEWHLINAGIPIINIHSRAKHLYSLYQKLLRREMNMGKIYDIMAMRIIVPDIKSCYEVLGIIHAHYTPLPGLIKNYIALPKPNGYQSLHTTIFCEKGKIMEIQIRTPEMQDYNENGIASHWAYSEGGKKNIKANAKELNWINRLKDFLADVGTEESFSALKIDFFKDRIFVFTPKGDVEDLPEGATPVDFAYAIHTDLGHAIRGAKVNGKMVAIDTNLKNGDVVEIIKGKGKELKPSMDWLKIVRTAQARHHIKSHLALTRQSKKT